MSSRFETSKCVLPPDEEMICPVCHDVLDTPLVTPCNHIFCKVCIEKTSETNGPVCPVCRDGFGSIRSLKQPIPMILNMLNKLTMKCGNEDQGCKELIPLEGYEGHVTTCPFKKIKCELCKGAMLSKDLSHHASHECPKRIVQCEKCTLEIPWVESDNHECLKSLVNMIEEKDARLLQQQKEIQDMKKLMERRFFGKFDFLFLAIYFSKWCSGKSYRIMTASHCTTGEDDLNEKEKHLANASL